MTVKSDALNHAIENVHSSLGYETGFLNSIKGLQRALVERPLNDHEAAAVLSACMPAPPSAVFGSQISMQELSAMAPAREYITAVSLALSTAASAVPNCPALWQPVPSTTSKAEPRVVIEEADEPCYRFCAADAILNALAAHTSPSLDVPWAGASPHVRAHQLIHAMAQLLRTPSDTARC